MSRTTRQELLEHYRRRYSGAGRRGKTKILNEFCGLAGYDRKHAIKLLNRKSGIRKKPPGPKRIYGDDVVEVLKTIWMQTEQMCSKRLKEALPLWLPAYENHYGKIGAKTKKKVLQISASHMDRLLAPHRVDTSLWRRATPKPGTLLKKKIPVRCVPWDTDGPGFLEADTVAHCGGSMSGDFIWSLTNTDIFSGWTCLRATWNKGEHGVLSQVIDIEEELPFEILGFDVDNGSEFLNHHLHRHFRGRKKKVYLTRSRPYHKNDNAHVEQKNWTHVRQLLGYDRLDNPDLVDMINDLYRNEWEQFHNFFCPSAKLVEKRQVKGKYIKKYDDPRTPAQRLIDLKGFNGAAQKRLKKLQSALDPFELKEGIEKKLAKIFEANERNKG